MSMYAFAFVSDSAFDARALPLPVSAAARFCRSPLPSSARTASPISPRHEETQCRSKVRRREGDGNRAGWRQRAQVAPSTSPDGSLDGLATRRRVHGDEQARSEENKRTHD